MFGISSAGALVFRFFATEGARFHIETQRTLTEELRVLAQHKTVIVATHSMPAMLMADRVYRMEGGRIVEEDRGDAVLTGLEGT